MIKAIGIINEADAGNRSYDDLYLQNVRSANYRVVEEERGHDIDRTTKVKALVTYSSNLGNWLVNIAHPNIASKALEGNPKKFECNRIIICIEP